MRLTLDLLGWTFTLAAEQETYDHVDGNGSTTSYPVPVEHDSVEPYDDRAPLGFRRNA